MKIQIQWDNSILISEKQSNNKPLDYFQSNAQIKIYTELIQKIVNIMIHQKVLSQSDMRELSFYFCNNSQIKSINHDYRSKNYATDVLAFPFDSSQEILGDIIISIEKAYEQAKSMEKSLIQELSMLIIHGILHLLGYDHERSLEDEKIMFTLQNKIFNEVFKPLNNV